MVVRLFVHTKPNSHKIHELSPQVSKATHGMVDKPWPAQLNKVVWEKRHNKEKSLVLSIGQVVPHGKIRYIVQNVGIDAVWRSVACRYLANSFLFGAFSKRIRVHGHFRGDGNGVSLQGSPIVCFRRLRVFRH